MFIIYNIYTYNTHTIYAYYLRKVSVIFVCIENFVRALELNRAISHRHLQLVIVHA